MLKLSIHVAASAVKLEDEPLENALVEGSQEADFADQLLAEEDPQELVELDLNTEKWEEDGAPPFTFLTGQTSARVV